MIKIIPKNDNFEPFLAKIQDFQSNSISVALPPKNTLKSFQDKCFTLIIEEDTKIKFLESILISNSSNIANFEILAQNEIFKRAYDRLPLDCQISGILEGKTINISAGGMQFLTKKQLPQNEIIPLNININDQILEVEFLVLRITQNPKNQEEFIISGKFENLNAQNKSIILQEGLKYKLALKGGQNE